MAFDRAILPSMASESRDSDYVANLFCAIGNIVIVSRRAEFHDEDDRAGRSFAEVGSRYRVVVLTRA